MSDRRLRIAVCFEQLGPYHWFRLNAATACAEVVAVEYFRKSSIYDWGQILGEGPFRRVTLFEGDGTGISASQAHARLAAEMAHVTPDAVAIPGWQGIACLSLLRWALENGIPTVLMCESTAWDHKRYWWKENFKRLLLPRFSSVFAGGTAHVEYLMQLRVPQQRISTGYDVVDNEYFARGARRARESRDAERKKHGLPEKYFLASARFVPVKNLPGLIRAYAQYRRRSHADPWSLVLLGDGPMRNEIRAEIAACGVGDSVMLPGFKQYEELPTYYGLAQAFVHASSAEPWGLVVNEAMASGLPVLVSDRCGCAVDLVREGENGFTFSPAQTDQLAELMVRVASSPLAAMGTASERIIAGWGSARFAQGLHTAAQTALEVGPSNYSMLTSAILRMLSFN